MSEQNQTQQAQTQQNQSQNQTEEVELPVINNDKPKESGCCGACGG